MRLPRLTPIAARGAARLLGSLLPLHCSLCGMASGVGNICSPCRSELPRAVHSCRICALPMPGIGAAPCGACLSRPPPWDAALAALLYQFPVDRMVQRLKFGRDLSIGTVLGEELLRAVRRETARAAPACLVPVPLHPRRLLARTFNQAEVLARVLGRGLELPVAHGLLRRTRHTTAQSDLDAAARRRNLRGAFACMPGASPTALDHVALIDDVMTTGATLAACSRAMRRAGVQRISVWVAARAEA